MLALCRSSYPTVLKLDKHIRQRSFLLTRSFSSGQTQKGHSNLASTEEVSKISLPVSSNNNYNHVSSKANVEYLNAILELSKARLSALVVSTSSFGFLAAATPVSYSTLVAASLGTALCSSSASTLNQILEQDRDAEMKRTSRRPLVTKKIFGTPEAYTLAMVSGSAGGMTLYLGTDPITTALGIGNIFLYAGVYTYIKPRSQWNTWVGAFVGAVPPVMGYTAATGGTGLLDVEAFIIGGTLFLWQFPHFFALAWMHRVDYARGGFQMVATNDTEKGCTTASLIKRYTYYLSTIPLISTVAGVTNSMFVLDGLLLNAYAIHVAHQFNKERSNAKARKVFLTSLWYLPCWMVLFLLHSRKFRNDVEDDSSDPQFIHTLRMKANDIVKKGKELCVYDMYIAKKDTTQKTSDVENMSNIDQDQDGSHAKP